MDRKILHANEGKILNNGETYGTTIFLALGADESTFYEITMEEYEAITNKQESEMM